MDVRFAQPARVEAKRQKRSLAESGRLTQKREAYENRGLKIRGFAVFAFAAWRADVCELSLKKTSNR